MGVTLLENQKQALEKMRNGCILCGDVGTGKSITALGYFHKLYGGKFDDEGGFELVQNRPDLYIITTARKRDTDEWNKELSNYLMNTDKSLNRANCAITVDSWNNIGKYEKVEGAFFIFDEQRVVGKGSWVKSFLKICKKNLWILLSATPGDVWTDYIPVFIANGFYKNRTDFSNQHLIYSKFTNYPKIDRVVGVRKLEAFRDMILVPMDSTKKTVRHPIYINVSHPNATYKTIRSAMWSPEKHEPITNARGLCYELRRCVNSDLSRVEAIMDILHEKSKAIIFYNFDYELDILKSVEFYGKTGKCEVREWNGHKHEALPEGDNWVYLVQYTAGAEGWNCVTTDTIIFYSLNYSYKTMQQASGRIDRMNTPFVDLYYYYLKSSRDIDLAILRAIRSKKLFNESAFYGKKVAKKVAKNF